MKLLFTVMLLAPGSTLCAQNIQLHYDFRHSVDPGSNAANFPTFSFEYFKQVDTVGRGSFLFKLQADLKGRNSNPGQIFTQISQSLRFWNPKVYISLNYSGGLGVTREAVGFYLTNSFATGLSSPFQWKGAWIATNVLLRYTVFEKPSFDPQVTLYFGRGILNYEIFVAGSFVFWTENRNQGIQFTAGETGKKFAFFGDPQIWFKLKGNLSVGSRVNVFYHLLSSDNELQIYPTAGFKYQF